MDAPEAAPVGETASSRLALAWLAVPLLFAAYRPIAYFAHNVDQMTAGEMGVTLAVSAGVAALLAAAAYAWLRRPEPAALIASLAVVAFYSYDMVHTGLLAVALRVWKRVEAVPVPLGLLAVLLLAAGAALMGWAVVSAKIPARESVMIAAALGATLVAMSSVSALNAYTAAARTRAASLAKASGRASSTLATETAKPSWKAEPRDPDIYVIVLDRYVRADVLYELDGYDNRPFIASLRKAGFFVADRAFSNYSITYPSLASMLNMRYMDEYLNLPGYEKRDKKLQVDRDVFYDLIGNSDVARALQKRGYTYIHVSSGWAATAGSDIADRLVDTSSDDEYSSAFLGTTMAAPLSGEKNTVSHRARVLGAFGSLGSVRDDEQPAFVFAHILSPHPPFVFAADGSRPDLPKELVNADSSETMDAFMDQHTYINKLVKQAVLPIAEERGRPVVIALLSDHGPNYRIEGDPPGADVPRRKHAILYALYCSDGVPAGMRDAETPVNLFRIIFDRYFGTRLGRLPDRAYYSSTEKWPYWPYEVTDLMGPSTPATQAVR